MVNVLQNINSSCKVREKTMQLL